MGLIAAGLDAAKGTLADQWLDFFTTPTFDEQTLVAPGMLTTSNAGRGANSHGSNNVISDGVRITVPENTALIVTDGGRIVSVSTEPGYYVFRNNGQPSLFAGSGVYSSLIHQTWERLKFGGEPAQHQRGYFVNLREIRNVGFGTPAPMPYRDFSLVVPGSSQAPVLRLRARGQYSLQVVDPIRFFQDFLPPNTTSYSLADPGAKAQLTNEFVTAFQAALQSLSRTTDIASLASHGPALASALSNGSGPGDSWLQRFGIEVVNAAVSAIEYDQESRELMDSYNKGTLLEGVVGNAYAQATVADAALATGESGSGGDGMIGLAMGLGSIGGTLTGLTQPAAPAAADGGTTQGDPVAVLAQLKAMSDQGLITPEQYATKQQEILDRM
jgi:membrane protease subunit (stomatin/prohibitin family)